MSFVTHPKLFETLPRVEKPVSLAPSPSGRSGGCSGVSSFDSSGGGSSGGGGKEGCGSLWCGSRRSSQ